MYDNENNQNETQPVITDFKGNPMLTLNPDSKYPFSFGLGKARLVLEHSEAIQKFVASQGKSID